MLTSSHQHTAMAIAAPRPLKVLVRVALVFALTLVMADYATRVFDLNRKSYGEGLILALVERLKTEPISSQWLQGPVYTFSCYGPAYYLAFDWAARAGGWRHSIVPGRIVSLVAALVVAGLSAIAAARLTGSIEMGLVAPLIFLVSPTVSYWMPYARVDMLALPFVLGAYLTVGPDRSRPITSAVLIALGSLVKPTVALTAIPLLAYLMSVRRWRDAALFAVLVAAMGGLAWGLIQWASRGYFLTAVVSGNRNPMLPWRGFTFGYDFLATPLGTIGAIVAAYVVLTEPAKALRTPYLLGFALSLAISTVTVCKQGSDRNYFLETALLASLLISVHGAPRLFSTQPRWALLALVVLALVLAAPSLREIKNRTHALAMAPESSSEIERRLRGGVGNAECLLADGTCIDVALAAGRAPLLNDSYLFAILVANGALDPGQVLDDMEQGRVKWLLLDRTIESHREIIGRNSQMWPAVVIESMAKHYELTAREGNVLLYRRRGVSIAPSPKPSARQSRRLAHG